MVRAEEGMFIKSKGNPSVFRGQTWSLGQGATCPAWRKQRRHPGGSSHQRDLKDKQYHPGWGGERGWWEEHAS